MPDTMTLSEKLRSAARSPDSWDLPGLLADAADALEDAEEDDDIPADYPVRPIDEYTHAEQRATCGHCGRTWDDALVTSMTPAPAGRCPFEAFHDYPEDDDDDDQLSNLDNCRREVVPGWTLDEILSREG